VLGEIWTGQAGKMNDYSERGQIEVLGVTGIDAEMGWFVPVWSADIFGGMNHRNLKDLDVTQYYGEPLRFKEYCTTSLRGAGRALEPNYNTSVRTRSGGSILCGLRACATPSPTRYHGRCVVSHMLTESASFAPPPPSSPHTHSPPRSIFFPPPPLSMRAAVQTPLRWAIPGWISSNKEPPRIRHQVLPRQPHQCRLRKCLGGRGHRPTPFGKCQRCPEVSLARTQRGVSGPAPASGGS
jgi:hypothetical protein